MKKKLFFAMIALCSTLSAWAWGQKGHDVVACIAEHHLDSAVKAKVEAALGGRSIIYYSKWLDDASHTPEYAYTKTWHYKNIDAGVSYDDAPLNSNGDVVTALEEYIGKLKSHKLTKEEESLALMIVVHLMGDLHQPMHMGHMSDRGGNSWKIKVFGKETNIHSYWDTQLVAAVRMWSYSEWQEQIDRATPEQQTQIEAGTIDEWARQTFAITTRVYDETPMFSEIAYDYAPKWFPVIEEQLLRGGLRLARILNEIYR